MLPCIESYQKVDLRTITLGVPPQEVRKGVNLKKLFGPLLWKIIIFGSGVYTDHCNHKLSLSFFSLSSSTLIAFDPLRGNS